MITMLHYDAVHSGESVLPGRKPGLNTQAAHLAFLEQHPYQHLTQQELDQVNTYFILRFIEPQ